MSVRLPRLLSSSRFWTLFTAGWLLLQVCGIVVLRYWQAGVPLLEVREALFARITSDTSLFKLSPKTLADTGFRWDDRMSGNALARWFPDAPLPLLDSIARLPGSMDRTRRLAGLVAGASGAECGGHALRGKLAWLRSGNGCCSDVTEVFLALAGFVGVSVREMMLYHHTVTEVWSTEERRWVFVDPYAGLMAMDGTGRALSLLDLRARILQRLPVEWVPIGSAHAQRDVTQDLFWQRLYFQDGKPDRVFSELGMNFGSDVFAQARFDESLSALPKAIQQLLGWGVGVRSPFVYLRDRASAAAIRHTQRLRLGILVDVLLTLVVVATTLIVHVRARRVPEHSSSLATA